MDADVDDHGHERIMLFRIDHHRVKLVMVQNPVVDSFHAGAVISYYRFFRKHPYFAILQYTGVSV